MAADPGSGTVRTYRVTFALVDGVEVVEPMVFEDVADPDELAALVYERARQSLLPGRVEVDVVADVEDMTVVVDMDEGTGGFYTPVVRFTIDETQRGVGG